MVCEMTEPGEALERTLREMDECCPMRDIHVIRDGKKIPCSWEGHVALKRRDAAVRWATLEEAYERTSLLPDTDPRWTCHMDLRENSRRAYEEASK